MTEKRKFTRVDTADKLSVRISPLEPSYWARYDQYDLTTKNLSMGGIAFEAPSFLPDRSPVKLELHFYDADYGTVMVFARVAWLQKQNNHYVMGVSFSWWNSDDDKKVILRFAEAVSPSLN